MAMNNFVGEADSALQSDSMPGQSPGFAFLIVFAAHLPLAVLLRFVPLMAAIHAWSVFALGLFFILVDRQPIRLIYLTGYIVGAEVFWRMAKAPIFWEFGKYSIGFLLILAMVKWHRRLQIMPLSYGLLLIPSVALTLGNLSPVVVRSAVSFNLSGPFLLTVAALFFSGIELNRQQVHRLMLFVIMPICCIAFLAFFSIETTSHIDFYESNVIASGGFGPNQVSAILGLGALSCWLYILDQKNFSKLSWFISGILLWFLAQAFLTFSRGGVYNFFIAGFLATPYLALRRRNLMTLLMFCSVLIAILFFILVKIDIFTGHALQDRFSDTETTGRWELVQKDLRLWQDNFLFGVGPGRAPYLRDQGVALGYIGMSKGPGLAAHTEYSRILAEHGLFGLLALLLLFIMFLRSFFKASNAYARGLTLAFMVWSLAEMSHAAMRLAAISYLYALPFARFEEE